MSAADDLNHRRDAALRTLKLDAAAGRNVQALQEAGVDALLLKGASITRWLYPGDAGMRRYNDVDLLVAPRRLAETMRVLAAQGYERRHEGLAPSERSSYAEPFDHPSGVTIDLHWTLEEASVPAERVWEVLWFRRRPMMLGGVTVPTLSHDANLVIVALHVMHHGGRVERHVEDLRRGVTAVDATAMASAITIARDLGALPEFAAGLRLVPAGRRLAAEHGLPEWTSRRSLGPVGPTAKMLRQIEETRGWRRRRQLILREIFPTPHGMRLASPLARRGRTGLVLAYVLRPLSLGWRVLRDLRR